MRSLFKLKLQNRLRPSQETRLETRNVEVLILENLSRRELCALQFLCSMTGCFFVLLASTQRKREASEGKTVYRCYNIQ